MNFFRRGGRKKKNRKASGVAPLPPSSAYCRICSGDQTFTRRWRRLIEASHCSCCGIEFESVRPLIQSFQPACPRCAEFIEQPTFDYAICDGCGSKFEFSDKLQPNLLPNATQREEMDKVGKVSPRT